MDNKNQSISAIIVDDSTQARDLLDMMVKEYTPKVTVLAQAANVPDAAELIKKHSPDLVFLDIEMPVHNGLALLDFVDRRQYPFDIIFTTGYNEYAVQAFSLSAVDYLMKPIDPDRLRHAVNRAMYLRNNAAASEKYGILLQQMRGERPTKIALSTEEGDIFVKVTDIVHMEANGAYTKIYLSTDEMVMVSKNLRFFSDALAQHDMFFRTHRSYLVNIYEIKNLKIKRVSTLQMSNGREVEVSRSKRSDFEAFYKANMIK